MMKTLGASIITPFLFLVFMACGLAWNTDMDEPDDPGVVARVNGEALYKKDLVKGMGLAGGAGLSLAPEELRGRVLRDLIDAELVYQTYSDTYGDNLGKDKVLRRFLDEEVYKGVKVSGEEVDAFWRSRIEGTPGEVFGKNDRSLERRIAFGKTRAVWESRLEVLRARARIDIFTSHLP